MKLIFFDHDKEVIEALERHLPTNLLMEFRCVDVGKLLKGRQIDAIVSPSHSFGFMDTGIDAVYCRLFPGIRERRKKRVARYRIRTLRGRHHLPIGSALPVTTGTDRARYVVCLPTMFSPEDIRGTDNVYWAFLGLLRWFSSVTKNMPGMKLACPGLGTGVGKLSPDESAQQIARAIRDFNANVPPPDDVVKDDHSGFVLRVTPCLQPDNRTNRQIPGQRGHRHRAALARASVF